jgi:uncharacterized protein (DUF1697 family)
MTTYIAILRGINVGGKRMIKMEALKQMFVGMGFQNTLTYIQSGNVIFRAEKSDRNNLEQRIAKAISDSFSLDVPVIVKDMDELTQIVSANPFLSDESKNVDYLHVTFLDKTPAKELIKNITDKNFHPDEFQMINDASYLYCPNGYSNSKLTNAFFESKLKVTATTRNWRTTIELLNLAEQTAKQGL